MFTNRARLVVICACLVASRIGWLRLGGPPAWLYLVPAGLLAVGYFRNGAVRPSFKALVAGDLDRARELHGSVRWPQYLARPFRSDWHLLNGLFASADDDHHLASEHLAAALDIGVRTEDNRSFVMLQVAMARVQSGDVHQTGEIFRQLRKRELSPEAADELARVAAIAWQVTDHRFLAFAENLMVRPSPWQVERHDGALRFRPPVESDGDALIEMAADPTSMAANHHRPGDLDAFKVVTRAGAFHPPQQLWIVAIE